MDLVLSTLHTGSLPSSLNHTFITLIAKNKTPEQITDYPPISLCNVLYKLVAKLLANKLKTLLPKIISPTQSPYVPGCLITNNILVAYELMHYLKKIRKRGSGFISLKLDISKSYDHVEWSFLEEIMHRMGFTNSWINRIMMCVKSVSFLVLSNGEPKVSSNCIGESANATRSHHTSSSYVQRG